jgi:1,4-alpha-glucan branching enzyme
MEKGYLALILHAHLPFVRHPEHEDFLEEDWLYEAITETYIPLIQVFEGLVRDKVPFRITMSLTPTLLSMLLDPLLQNRYLRHLDKLIELAGKEIERTRWQSEFNNLALMYYHRFTKARQVFCDDYKMNIVNAFKKFYDLGTLEIITCGATHGFLPLMEVERRVSIRAQVMVGVQMHRKLFGRNPPGIWLPECAYHPGDDEILKEFGIKYFITDTHGILFGSPRPKFGVFAPCYCKSGVAAFARDVESSKSVWSSQEGYPGDYNYREFYRDVGYDLEHDYVKPYILPDGTRINTGIKYYRITGETDHKEPYVAQWAIDKAAEHAGNFMFNREKQVEHLSDFMDRRPIMLSPYDAELFGHWWFEGPDWMGFLMRKIHFDQKTIKLITPSDYLRIYPRNQVLTPSYSSWGWKGYSEVWLEGSNDWIYRHLHKAVERMIELANMYSHSEPNGLTRRGLNQAARELLLAQSSDWAFIMKTQTHASYAYRRTKDHIYRFTRLYDEIKSGRIDERSLADIEGKDNLFPDIDYKMYCK